MATRVRRVEVGGDAPSAKNVIDYAAALIRAFGWNQITTSDAKSSEQAGFTLHDAIGESCTRLSRAAEPHTSGSKDWNVQDREGRLRNLRTEATTLVHQAIADSGFALDPNNASASDVQFNDKAKDASEVIAILEAASGKAGA